jgi:hypothetical protein
MVRCVIRSFLGAAILAQALMVIAATAWGADTVVTGKSAQALRCAAYIGMAARFGYDEGYLTEHDAETMTLCSVRVIDRWVPLSTGDRLAAYRATLGEIGPREHGYALVARHAEWCVRAFDPTL